MDSLSGKVAVITGGGSGIGRSISLALADAGVHLVLADIHSAGAEAVAQDAEQRGVRAIAIACDVSNRDQVEELAERAYAEFGVVDILCNNAGVSWRPHRSILDVTLNDWKFIFGINLFGVVNGLDAFLPRMRRQPGKKHIVNTASIGGLIPLEGWTVYSSSKAAVIALSEAMANELAPYGFGVTILCPGIIPTNLGESTNRIRGECEEVFEPVLTPAKDRLSTFQMASANPVGAMVCRAIEANQLYLHTATIPGDLIADRTQIQWGSNTLKLVPEFE